jgi:translation initiation factor 3 subunit L
MYEISWPKLSDRFFKSQPWPDAPLIAPLVDRDHVFCLLYKELRFRHLHSRPGGGGGGGGGAGGPPTVAQRVEAWNNYCDLFGVILHGNVNMILPTCWLWDMIDEFLYQFQSFQQFRAKLLLQQAQGGGVGGSGGFGRGSGGASGSSPTLAEELAALASPACADKWAPADVVGVLNALAERSGVVAALRRDGGRELAQPGSEGYYPGNAKSNVLPMLGYFALVGLERVHVLLGDYRAGLQSLAPINPLEPRGGNRAAFLLTAKLPAAHVSLYYYSAFAYLMLRRFTDAARCLNTALGYVARAKPLLPRNAAYDQILKKQEQMYALLALCAALCPAAARRYVDEGVAQQLGDKFGERLARVAQGDDAPLEEIFAYGCPRFAAPPPPGAMLEEAAAQATASAQAGAEAAARAASEGASEVQQAQAANAAASASAQQAAAASGAAAAAAALLSEPFAAQLALFQREVRRAPALPSLKQHLRLYSSISLAKLAELLDTDAATLKAQLLAMQASAVIPQWPGAQAASGDPLAEETVSAADLDFTLGKDPATGEESVTVADPPPARPHAEALARAIGRFDETVRELEAAAAVAAAQQAAAAAQAAAQQAAQQAAALGAAGGGEGGTAAAQQAAAQAAQLAQAAQAAAAAAAAVPTTPAPPVVRTVVC